MPTDQWHRKWPKPNFESQKIFVEPLVPFEIIERLNLYSSLLIYRTCRTQVDLRKFNLLLKNIYIFIYIINY